MSRMDRYQKIHKESQRAEQKNNFSVRKEVNQPKDHYQDYQADHYDEDDYQTPQKKRRFGFRRNKEKRPKRKSSFKKKIFKFLLLFILIEVASFFVGKVQAELDSSIPQQEVMTFNGVSSGTGNKNILLLGSDSREGETARADTIMVLNIDSGKPKLASFMRDTYVNIPGYGYDKINSAYAYGGADLLRQTLELNFGITCRYYAIVDFKTFEKAIDAIFSSGVKIDAEKDLDLDGVFINQGIQKMDGHTLLQYARFRMDEEGDFGRVRRQQQVMSAIFGQMKNPLVLLRLPYAAGKVWGYTATDLPMTHMVVNSLHVAKGVSGIERLSIPVEGSWQFGEYDVGSVLDIDEEMNRQAAQAFFNQ
ncbi:LCP family protein required for cell wall assembly [Enterococcus sp. PF1-24]|uniref:LCP family protein n=1 Tax=unclassified Enterococcus TaxID=2608891 RepID=UPI002473CF0C|nr:MULTISPECIES: LCP family protein [unclassified Enterococcus]MDH6364196.1 LCP family protein required for cell wall assembly [Enterococcus sp. PFB1-1]MDH6401297.1 LCP family protein required for cell wall assembly [Enterococcus sp. PF1-24]